MARGFGEHTAPAAAASLGPGYTAGAGPSPLTDVSPAGAGQLLRLRTSLPSPAAGWDFLSQLHQQPAGTGECGPASSRAIRGLHLLPAPCFSGQGACSSLHPPASSPESSESSGCCSPCACSARLASCSCCLSSRCFWASASACRSRSCSAADSCRLSACSSAAADCARRSSSAQQQHRRARKHQLVRRSSTPVCEASAARGPAVDARPGQARPGQGGQRRG